MSYESSVIAMSNIIDIRGQRYGRLTVVACAGRTKRGNTIWTCRCDCGNEKIVQASHLRSGSTMSCGCLRQEGYVNRGRKK
jgi:ribosomal protein L13